MQSLRFNNAKLQDERSTESSRWDSERRTLNDELRAARQQQKALKAAEAGATAQLQQVREKVASVTKELADERQKAEERRKAVDKELAKARQLAEEQKLRAQCSEVSLEKQSYFRFYDVISCYYCLFFFFS